MAYPCIMAGIVCDCLSSVCLRWGHFKNRFKTTKQNSLFTPFTGLGQTLLIIIHDDRSRLMVYQVWQIQFHAVKQMCSDISPWDPLPNFLASPLNPTWPQKINLVRLLLMIKWKINKNTKTQFYNTAEGVVNAVKSNKHNSIFLI